MSLPDLLASYTSQDSDIKNCSPLKSQLVIALYLSHIVNEIDKKRRGGAFARKKLFYLKEKETETRTA